VRLFGHPVAVLWLAGSGRCWAWPPALAQHCTCRLLTTEQQFGHHLRHLHPPAAHLLLVHAAADAAATCRCSLAAVAMAVVGVAVWLA
jgi:hypothetical protein